MEYQSHQRLLFTISLVFVLFPAIIQAQMITGAWKGRINRQKVELKIIQNGDSLTGTSYYYESPNNYRRYSIKGYFDPNTNSAVWWDDQLLEEKSARFSLGIPGKVPLLSRADFNCPGGGRMMLDGKAAKKESEEPGGEVHLDKISRPEFDDEWDFVIDNYTVGANDPYLIDSIGHIRDRPVAAIAPVRTKAEEKPVAVARPKPPKITEQPKAEIKSKPEERKTVQPVAEKKTVAGQPKPEIPEAPVLVKVPTIEEKFTSRTKILTKEIPLTGDSVELRFYDNAEIDGDSISLFLNNKLIYSHIRLLGSAYTIKLAVSELTNNSELIMVAENLGAIPPNTSYMVAIVGDKRYDAYLSSTEGSSAMIRFKKE